MALIAGGTASPRWILRHHSPSPIHAICFCSLGGLSLCLAGDEQGRISVTALQDRRARYFWQAHGKGVLGLDLIQLEDDICLISQSRDNKLCIWKLSEEHALPSLSVLPSRIQDELPTPTLLRSTDINALNYCPLSLQASSQLLAVAHTVDAGFADVLSLPSFARVWRAIGKPDVQSKGQRAPMCMTMHLLPSEDKVARLLAGYEDGFMRLWIHPSGEESSTLLWQRREHSESIMSSAVCSAYAISVAADNRIVRYDLSDGAAQVIACNGMGNASVSIRQDEKVFAVGGWDGVVRIYDSMLQHLGSLRYHKDTVQALQFIHPRSVTWKDDQDGVHDNAEYTLISGGKEGRLCLWTI